MDKKTALEYARLYALEVTKKMRPNAIYLYGSYVTGQACADSDIDVAVLFDEFDGDFLKTSSWLWSLTWQLNSLIEPILLDRTKDHSGFAEEIINSGKLIYHDGFQFY